jgi:hypothetical protein
MPIVLALHCAIFDIFQCGEALAKAGVLAPVSLLDALVGDWWECVRRIGIRGDPGDQAPGDVVVASERSRRR